MDTDRQESKPESMHTKPRVALIRDRAFLLAFLVAGCCGTLLVLFLMRSIFPDYSAIATALAALLAPVPFFAIWSTWSDKEGRALSDKVGEAEREAFSRVPAEIARQIREMERDQESLKAATSGLAQQIEARIEYLQTGSLFNLYSKQIQQYQYQTRQQASYSFFCAILAMGVGLVFVGCGAWHALKQGVQPTDVAAGSAVSIIGGAIGAYITKTFLEVHKISLAQLNRYFQQPVVNETILTIQRLSDTLPDPQHRSRAYQQLIQKVIGLIGNEGTQFNHAKEDVLPRNSVRPARLQKAKTERVQQETKLASEDA